MKPAAVGGTRCGLFAVLLPALALAACGGEDVLLGVFGKKASRDAGADGDPALDAEVPDAGSDAGGPSDAGADAFVPRPECLVPEERGALPCEAEPSAAPFEPRIKWTFPPASLALEQAAPPGTPLVANLTDDNGDGRIDLCDVPDVLVTARTAGAEGSAIWILSGDTGDVKGVLDEPLLVGVAPAIADLNLDGTPEIVAVDANEQVFAMTPDGRVQFRGAKLGRPAPDKLNAPCYAVSVYDLKGDGRPEILVGFEVFDARGFRLFAGPPDPLGIGSPAVMHGCIAPIAADLEGDGQLEVLFGHEVRSASGGELWKHQLVGPNPSVPLVAQLDATPELEVVLSTQDQLFVLSHAGGEIAKMPYRCGGSAISVHDFDGDGRDELALPSCDGLELTAVYALEDKALVARWPLQGAPTPHGYSALASFDLRAQGMADLLYADPERLALYAGLGGELLLEGGSGGALTYGTPVVADIDNDGHAELLVPHFDPAQPGLLTVLEDDERWASARRIWNQHAYHVTNVHEDARIPAGKDDAPEWPLRMRSNALTQGNRLCTPQLAPAP